VIFSTDEARRYCDGVGALTTRRSESSDDGRPGTPGPTCLGGRVGGACDGEPGIGIDDGGGGAASWNGCALKFGDCCGRSAEVLGDGVWVRTGSESVPESKDCLLGGVDGRGGAIVGKSPGSSAIIGISISETGTYGWTAFGADAGTVAFSARSLLNRAK